MLPTTDILTSWFDQFNARYFGNGLPRPKIKLSKARTRLGQFSCRCARRLLRTVRTDFTIAVSIYYDCEAKEYQTVLLHEMIHYYISYNNLRDTSPHGRIFRRIMRDINATGWQISVSTSTKGWKVRNAGKRPPRQYLLLALRTTRGQLYFSPVSPAYFARLERKIQSIAHQIAWHEWYTSSDAQFEHFACVRSLRGVPVTEARLEEYRKVMNVLDLQACKFV